MRDTRMRQRNRRAARCASGELAQNHDVGLIPDAVDATFSMACEASLLHGASASLGARDVVKQCGSN